MSKTPDSSKIDLFFISDSPTKYKIPLQSIPAGSYKFDLLLDAKKYNLTKHFLYQSRIKKSGKRTFANMSFSSKPPGEKFGPWPGWRFVPDMPKILIITGEKSYNIKYYFLGDEEYTKKLHAFAKIDITDNTEHIFLQIESIKIVPINIRIFISKNIKLSDVSLKIYNERINKYPRLLVNQNDLNNIRISGSKRLKKVQQLFENWNLRWKISEETRTLPGKERLNIIDKLLLSSFMAVITEDENTIIKAIRIFNKYTKEILKVSYTPMQIDTQTGECIFNMCLAYDWLFNYLNEKEKKHFKDSIKKAADKLKKFLNPERDDFAQAHFLGCISGLLAYSITFFEEKDSKENIKFIARAFKTAINMLPEDGSYPHGINLWIYEYTFLVRITELLSRFTNHNHWKRTNFWINSSLFRNYTTSFDGLYGITFGDPQYRVGGDAWIHYLISKRTNDEKSFSFAEWICDLPTSGIDYRSVPPRRRIYEVIYSAELKLKIKDSLHPFKIFKDTGQIFIKDQRSKILITAKAGPPIGLRRFNSGEYGGYGHSDPCNGSFLILKNNQFIICGPESTYKRNSDSHNIITLDGYGQYGDKMVWAPDFNIKENFAEIIRQKINSKYFNLKMDLTHCYLNFLEVNFVYREFIFIKPDVLFVIDTIDLKNKRDIEWNLHHYKSIKYSKKLGHFKISNGKESIILKLHFLRSNNENTFPHGSLDLNLFEKYDKFILGKSPFIPAYPNSGKEDKFMKVIKNDNKAIFLSVFILNDNYNYFKYHTIKSEQDSWSINFLINNRSYSLRIKDNTELITY